MQGFCSGIFSSITPVMVKEYSPIEISGSLGTLQNILILVGVFSSFLFSFFFEAGGMKPAHYWFYGFAFPLLQILLQQLLFAFVYTSETPKYLLVKGRNEEAKELIGHIYNEQFQEAVYHEKLRDLEADSQEIEGEEKEYPKDHPIAIFLGFSLQAFQQLSGVNVIQLYSGELAEGFLPSTESFFPIIVNGQKLLFGIIGYFMMGVWGRRAILTRGMLTVALCEVGMFIGFMNSSEGNSWAPVLILGCLCVFLFSFNVSLGPLTWLYVSEIVQPGLIPFTTMTNWIFSTLIIGSFPIIRSHSENKDVPGLFIFYAACTFVIFGIFCALMVETKDKTELQIREDFNHIRMCS